MSSERAPVQVKVSGHIGLDTLKSQLTQKAATYLGKVPDAHQYPVIAGELHGQTTSSPVESLNKANIPARKLDLYNSLLKIAELTEKRFNENAAKDANATGELPPAVLKYLAERMEKATKYQNVTVVDMDTKERYRVPSLSVPGLVYNANLKDMTCDCGQPNVDQMPCEDIIAGSRLGGKQLHQYMLKGDTVAGWRELYAGVTFPPIPSSAEIAIAARTTHKEMADINRELPPSIRNKRGAPQQKRKRGVLESQRKRAKPTCQNCFAIGHKANKCPNMPRASQATVADASGA